MKRNGKQRRGAAYWNQSLTAALGGLMQEMERRVNPVLSRRVAALLANSGHGLEAYEWHFYRDGSFTVCCLWRKDDSSRLPVAVGTTKRNARCDPEDDQTLANHIAFNRAVKNLCTELDGREELKAQVAARHQNEAHRIARDHWSGRFVPLPNDNGRRIAATPAPAPESLEVRLADLKGIVPDDHRASDEVIETARANAGRGGWAGGPFADVVAAVERERRYQDRAHGTIAEHGHDVAGWLTVMRKELREAEDAWAGQDGDRGALEEILQVVAVGMACLEQHGVVERAAIALVQNGAALERERIKA